MFLKVTNIAACIGSVGLIASTQKLQAKELVACHDCCKKRLPKARELPIYETKDDFICEYDEKSTLPLISEISVVRKKLFEYASYVNMAQDQIMQMYQTGVAHSKSTFDYLNDEENKAQRILIIASSGLVGLLCARRGGIFKKAFYTSLGSGVTFYIFYPSLAKEYAVTASDFSKHHINNLLTKYGGYDTKKIAEDTNAKIDYIKSTMKFETIMNMLNSKFYKKDKVTKEDGDKENINQDMYTTRSS